MTTFEVAEFPDRTSCTVIAELVEGIATIELKDAAEQKLLFDVYSAAVQRINMPRFRASVPDVIRAPFEGAIGMGIVHCKVLKQEREECLVQLPCMNQVEPISISSSLIVRRF